MVGLSTTFVALAAFFWGLSGGIGGILPAVASIVAMVEPMTASLFGVMFLNERLNLLQIFDMALILFTVTALSIHASVQKESVPPLPPAE
jgi:drug/metabolite transporter, DME family